MPSVAHELAVLALGEDPALLALLIEKLTGIHLAAPLTREDAAVRFARAIEVRPDLLFAVAGGGSLAVEVQGDEDDDKGRRWNVLMAVLRDGSGVMGDLAVVTWSPRVARWALRAAHARGPLGTTTTLTPIVILLSGEVIDALLDEDHPELAFFAAWAMQHRHGRRARLVVRRALAVTDRLAPALREAQRRAIFSVLSERMIAFLEETTMDVSKIPETPRVRAVREQYEAFIARSEARGQLGAKVEALLAVLAARGLAPSEADRDRVLACTDAETLDRWITRAATAISAAEAFG